MGGIKGSRTRTEAHLFGHCSKLHERQAGAKTVTEKPWNHPCFPSDTGERGGQWRPMVTEQVMVTATPGTTDLPEEASLRLFLKSGSWKTETLPQGYKYPVNSRTRLEPAQGLPLWRGCGDQLLPWIVRCPWGCLSLSLSLAPTDLKLNQGFTKEPSYWLDRSYDRDIVSWSPLTNTLETSV